MKKQNENRLLNHIAQRWAENLSEAERIAFRERHRDMAKEVLERLYIVWGMIEENCSMSGETNNKAQDIIEELSETCALLEKLLQGEYPEDIFLKVLQAVITVNYDFVELLDGVQEYILAPDVAAEVLSVFPQGLNS